MPPLESLTRGLAALCLVLAPLGGVAAVEAVPATSLLANASAESGQRIFARCGVCHSHGPNAAHRVGPNLWDVFGRPIGAQPGFDYSPALRTKEGLWDERALDAYLRNPQGYAPGSRMFFAGLPDLRERADLIAYLRTLGDKVTPAAEEAASPVAPRADPGVDFEGLPTGPGREAVYFTCRACHSLQQFSQQRLPRAEWDDLLTAMVSNNGMAEPEPWTRTLILNYLTTHFGSDSRDWQGLPPGPGRDTVHGICAACHSLAIVKQQGLSRESWDETLEWMVEEQSMPPLVPAQREVVLDYLATHFGLD